MSEQIRDFGLSTAVHDGQMAALRIAKSICCDGVSRYTALLHLCLFGFKRVIGSPCVLEGQEIYSTLVYSNRTIILDLTALRPTTLHAMIVCPIIFARVPALSLAYFCTSHGALIKYCL